MKLTPPHFCWEWDGLYVRPWDDEVQCCQCRFTALGWIRFWFAHLLHGEPNE